MAPSIGAEIKWLSDDEKKVLEALWQFRPGARLPFPLVKLAVEVDSGEDWDSTRLFKILERIVKANVLEAYVERGEDPANRILFLAEYGCLGYKVPGNVSAWLAQNRDPNRQGLFQEPQLGPTSEQQPADLRDRAGPSSPQQPAVPQGDHAGPSSQQQPAPPQGGIGAAAAAAATEQRRLEKRRLFLAFLAAYGNDQGSENVPQKAEQALGLGIDGWADPTLSERPHAEKLAHWTENDLDAETVVAAILGLSGANFVGIPGLDRGVRGLFDIFISTRVVERAGERKSSS